MPPTHLNQRPVKLVDDLFTVETSAELKREAFLCDHCGRGATCLTRVLSAEFQDDHGVAAPIKRCGEFLPVLGFRPPFLGLEYRFNTFRLGAGWMKRLKVGGTVVLGDGRNGNRLGLARVESFDAGPLKDILRAHASRNHMMLEESAGHVAKLAKVLRSHYGPHLLSADKPATVIYLERINDHDQSPE